MIVPGSCGGRRIANEQSVVNEQIDASYHEVCNYYAERTDNRKHATGSSERM